MSEIKYKLLKELPFCKNGTIGINNDDLLTFWYDNKKDQYIYDLKEIETLIEQGWIEPVYEKSQEDLIHDIYKLSDKEFQAEFTKVMLEKYEIKEKE